MSDSDDLEDMLHRFLSDDQADRLIAGQADVGAGSAFDAVAGLLAAMREPSDAGELAGTDALLATMSEAMRSSATSAPTSPSRRPVLTRIVSGKIIAITAVTFLSAGAAAAATGNLPDPVQRSVSTTFSHVGIDLPRPHDRPNAHADAAASASRLDAATSTSEAPSTTVSPSTTVDPTTSAATTTIDSTVPSSVEDDADDAHTPVGPDATGPAAKGLCTAYSAGGDHGHRLESTAMTNLAAAAAAAGQTIEAYCATVLAASDASAPPTSAGDDETDDHGDDQSEDQSEDHGNGAPDGSNPSATAPGHDGADSGDDHGESGDDHGSDAHAGGSQSGGHGHDDDRDDGDDDAASGG